MESSDSLHAQSASSITRKGCCLRWSLRISTFFAVFAFISFGAISARGQLEHSGPSLSLSRSNETLTLSWPTTGYYYMLERGTNLLFPIPFSPFPPFARWNFLATASPAVSLSSYYWFPWAAYSRNTVALNSNLIGTQYAVGLTLTNSDEPQFFRLRAPLRLWLTYFAVFYDGLLEFSGADEMTINGPVHANGPIYTGTDSPLTFEDTVTTSSTISSPANAGHSEFWMHTATCNGSPGSITNVTPLSWPYSPYNQRVLIDPPDIGESSTNIPGTQRLFNQADVLILVSNVTTEITNSTVTLRLQEFTNFIGSDGFLITTILPIMDTNAVVVRAGFGSVSTVLPFLSITNRFYDHRERKTNIVTQIDVGRYREWMNTNEQAVSKFPLNSSAELLYVADLRSVDNQELAVVRLVNGTRLPENRPETIHSEGFSLATPNPLYVWGDYNCTNAALLASADTSATVPALLISDAVTLLSSNWSDSASFLSNSSGPPASSTLTVNAAIVTGNVPTTGPGPDQFSGGVQNLTRLLEDWTGSELWLNGSLICIYSSARATNQFVLPGRPESYFRPPELNFNYDQKFSTTNRAFQAAPFYTPWVGTGY